MEAIVQGQKFVFLNIYTPNKTSEQIVFFDQIKDELRRMDIDDECRIVAGGDFNVILDPKLDGQGGNPKLKESVNLIKNICLTHDLVDIWRVRNPTLRRFTWSQKKPVVQRRLDFWLVDDALQEDVDLIVIIPSIKSDHSAIVLVIKSIENQTHGPSFWKFNVSLLNNGNYVALINNNFPVWLEEFKDVADPRLFWDLIKYKIRQVTITYSKEKARERKAKLSETEEKLQHCQELCDEEDPSTENMKKLEILKTEYDLLYDYIAQGAIVRSRARWYEQGEKSSKYFLNLESSRGKKVLCENASLMIKLKQQILNPF